MEILDIEHRIKYEQLEQELQMRINQNNNMLEQLLNQYQEDINRDFRLF